MTAMDTALTTWTAACRVEQVPVDRGVAALLDWRQVALFRLDVSNQFFLRWGLLFIIFGAAAGVIGSLLGLSRYLREADGTGEEIPTGAA